ncbi:DEAD/DEAH box helicase [Candidatus Azobacteroides pseudotrichonymphae]|uniref:ATP-dependent RNA helicase n=1 Tax=Azobacteroides pseudotrichonymphae genomovar. CFP2 TaxID=511995 RepID=B6YQ39_AZOPC|nr:DEAD/DEAH box helicase [Candidatus Azobacteroides pseudotrichonymphae]BAG83311.1 putative ATP-dependent RNA helicase [Candidatus Azobacteroides pseudotrichonymphae genomovar. CFP2]
MKTFEELGIIPDILKAITEIGYENPMPIQEKVIPYLLGKGNEVIALAETGTGKTAAFGLPILQQIQIHHEHPQAVVLCPTRELCLQIANDINNYSKYLKKLKILPIYGGSNIESQIKALRGGVHIVVATSGRLIDLIKRGAVDLQYVRNVVLDEADEMLSVGFSESIDEILRHIPEDRNMLLFSATMPLEISWITKKYMRNPHEIVIGKKNSGGRTVRHVYYMVSVSDRYFLLKRLVDYHPNIYGIVFCRTKNETQEIANFLIRDGYNVDALHGDLSQSQRDYIMQKFRLHNIQLLVATDVASRGLDVDGLSHIINYGLPSDIESYIHRSGRTGRAGKTGTSIAIIHLKEKFKIRAIERCINKTFEKGIIPSGKEICKKRLFHFIDKLEGVEVNEGEIKDIFPSIYYKLDWLSKEDIVKRIISNEFNRLIDYYQDVNEIKIPKEKDIRNKRRLEAKTICTFKKDNRNLPSEGYMWLFINLGRVDGLIPSKLIGLLNDNISGRKVNVGKIDLMRKFTFFEVKKTDKQRVIQNLNNIEALGKRVLVEGRH